MYAVVLVVVAIVFKGLTTVVVATSIATGLSAVLGILTSFAGVVRVVKAVSEQITLQLPDHSAQLDYHHAVIKDLKFVLKWARQQAGGTSCWWEFLAFLACCCCTVLAHQTSVFCQPKNAIGPTTRVIVMIDDLDRCPSNQIMEVTCRRHEAAQSRACSCAVLLTLRMDSALSASAVAACNELGAGSLRGQRGAGYRLGCGASGCGARADR